MYAQVGDFCGSKGSPTVPLKRILRNAVFFKSQNQGKAGTLYINEEINVRVWMVVFKRKFSYKIKHTVLFIRYVQCTSMKSKTKGKRGKKGNVVEKRKMTQVLYMSFDRFLLAVESRDLSQTDNILIREHPLMTSHIF